MADEKTITFEEHTKVQQQLDTERDRARRFEGQLADLEKKFDAYKGVDLDKLKADSQALEQMRRENAKTPEQIDALIKDTERKFADKEAAIRREVQEQVNALTKERDGYQTKYNELFITDRAMNEIGSLFNDDMHPFIKQYIRQSVGVNDAGDFVIKDDRGEMRYSRVDRARGMSLKEFGEEIAEKHPSAARATTRTGDMHTNRSNGSSGDMTPERWLRLSKEQRAQFKPEDQRKYSAEAVRLYGNQR